MSHSHSAGYDALLIATGGQARRIRGVHGNWVHHLRTRADADACGNG